MFCLHVLGPAIAIFGQSTFKDIKKHSDGTFRVLINQGNKTKQ